MGVSVLLLHLHIKHIMMTDCIDNSPNKYRKISNIRKIINRFRYKHGIKYGIIGKTKLLN